MKNALQVSVFHKVLEQGADLIYAVSEVPLYWEFWIHRISLGFTFLIDMNVNPRLIRDLFYVSKISSVQESSQSKLGIISQMK